MGVYFIGILKSLWIKRFCYGENPRVVVKEKQASLLLTETF
ncbi:MAG TPA: hypothetical protein PLO53_07740 [Candidatus Hydrogenedentes bacterium]|nr:hypothetical protein [Candidatus Hydrogenedentota bacterium]